MSRLIALLLTVAMVFVAGCAKEEDSGGGAKTPASGTPASKPAGTTAKTVDYQCALCGKTKTLDLDIPAPSC